MDNGEQKPLLIGISARSLFDMTHETELFQKKGMKEYRQYQHDKRMVAFGPGVAYRFIQRMLSLNSIAKPGEPLVEVAIVSHMDPDAGCRVMNSLKPLGIDASESIFTSGGDVTRYLQALGVNLYLSFDEANVKTAIDAGIPAGHIMTREAITDHDTVDGEIRLAFDFDGCLSDDDSERVFQRDGLKAFESYEEDHIMLPLEPGPMYPFIRGLARIQEAECAYSAEHEDYHHRMKISIVTMRSALSGTRVMNTLDSWGVKVDEAFYMGGHDKTPILATYHPHLFLDDNPNNIAAARSSVMSVHVPFGVVNRTDESNKRLAIARQ